MTRDEAIAEVKRGTGFRANLDTTILAAFDAAQRQLELGKTLPWFLITYDAELAYVANSPTLDLPEDFIRLTDEYDPYYIEASSTNVRIPILRKNYTEGRDAYGNTDDPSDATRPKVFVIRTRTDLLFYPIPTESFSVFLTYYAKQPLVSTLAADGENEWLREASEVLIGEAGLRVASMTRDKDALGIFSARRDAGQRALMGEIIEQEIALRPLIMGRNN